MSLRDPVSMRLRNTDADTKLMGVGEAADRDTWVFKALCTHNFNPNKDQQHPQLRG